MSRSLDQHRAAFALRVVGGIAAATDEARKRRYSTIVRNLPVVVLNHGLGQALASLLAAKNTKREVAKAIYGSLVDWLCGEPSVQGGRPCRVYPPSPGSQPDLMTQLVAGDRARYLRAQQEALAVLGWFKKFAEAYLPEPDPKEED